MKIGVSTASLLGWAGEVVDVVFLNSASLCYNFVVVDGQVRWSPTPGGVRNMQGVQG